MHKLCSLVLLPKVAMGRNKYDDIKQMLLSTEKNFSSIIIINM